MANSLTRDFTGTPTNAKKFTISFWAKFTKLANNASIIANYGNSGSDDFAIQFRNDNTLGIIDWKGAGVANNHESQRKFDDPTSWYHIVVAGDSTESTASDRLKLYVNGLRETAWASATDIGQNNDYNFNKETDGTSIGHVIGQSGNGGNIFEGYLAHIHNVDGSALAPTVFGETDSTTGEWKPILTPSYTVGTNGWFLKFENSGALGTDSSGNRATFTVSGNVKQSVSTPSNTFNTLNPVESYKTEVKNALKYGGTGWEDGHSTSDGFKGSAGILACTKGKWYFEVKHIEGMYTCVGISKANSLASNEMINTTYRSPFIQGNEGDGFAFQAGTAARNIQRGDNTEVSWNDGSGSNIASVSANDILMIAYDLDAGKIWWGKNGTWNTVPSSDTATSSSDIASGNNAHKTWTANGEFFRPAVAVYQRTYGSGGANPNTIQCNFGEGRFGTTAVSSGNADSQGNGTFEYAPPTNFLAVCTSNIKTYG